MQVGVREGGVVLALDGGLRRKAFMDTLAFQRDEYKKVSVWSLEAEDG